MDTPSIQKMANSHRRCDPSFRGGWAVLMLPGLVFGGNGRGGGDDLQAGFCCSGRHCNGDGVVRSNLEAFLRGRCSIHQSTPT